MKTELQNGVGCGWARPDLDKSGGRKLRRTFFLSVACCAAFLPAISQAQVQSVVASNTVFALNLYTRLATNSGNIFFSPYSISTCMAMTYAGARGNTATQMTDVFGFGANQDQFASDFALLDNAIVSHEQPNAVELRIANALWTQIGFPVLPSFLQTATNQYQANVNQADFVTDPEGVRQAINAWVAETTEDKIQQILPRGIITPLTRIVLANAIYFKGAWTYTFAETNTSLQPFYVSSATQVFAPLMHQPILDGPDLLSPAFSYMQTDDFQALELPYGTNQLAMLLLLPTRVDGLTQLEQQLTPSFLSDVLAQMRPQQVDIYLPRFTNDYLLNLVSTLGQMGLTDAFVSGVADFSGMDGMHDLFLSFVMHKAWVQVDEAGTEAAAATAIGVSTGAYIPPPPPFRADHPFIFLIRDTQTGSVLFVGRLANPTQDGPVPVPVPHLAVLRYANTLSLHWPYPSTPWKLQQSLDLSGTNWTTITSRGVVLPDLPFIGPFQDGTNYLIPLLPGAGNLFFRLSPQ